MNFFPNPPRGFPGRRALRVLSRSGHILATGVLLGGHIFAQPEEVLLPWLIGAIATGGLMLTIDLYSSLAVMCETRGMIILTKMLLVALVAVFWDARIGLLITVVAIGGVGSHAARGIRHRVLFLRGRVVPDESKG